MVHVGIGYDVHAFAEGRKLILGGVEIPHPRGLDGHSDADALMHAICDAILGALGEVDIGHFFPNTDPRWMHELARQIQSAEVTLSAKLASAQATVERLLSLKAGDFIELDLAPLIQGTVEGVPIFEGPYGTSNGRYALKVERLLAGSNLAIAKDSRRIE